MDLSILKDTYGICRFEQASAIPSWARSEDFMSVTRTSDELSIVCKQEAIPDRVECSRGWRSIRIEEELNFGMVGVLGQLIVPLARAGISVFIISTFRTDYVLIMESALKNGIEVLQKEGHHIREQ